MSQPTGLTSLAITGNTFLGFRNGDYRWIDVKLFDFPEVANDADLLAALIAHPQFRDGYMGGPAGEGEIHGPYNLDAITVARYQLLTLADAERCLDGFCSLDGVPTPAALASDIEAVVRRRLRDASATYWLPPIAEARHEVAFVLLEFRELVVICRQPAVMALVVMAID